MSVAIDRLISAAMSAPMTHVVVTRYADGRELRHEARSAGAAENWAIGERRKLGRSLVNRETGETVMAVAVTVVPIG